MLYPIEYRQNLKTIGDMVRKYSDMLYQYGDEENDIDKKIQWHFLSMLCESVGYNYQLTVSHLQDLNTLSNAIEKLPKSAEFDDLKEALRKTSERVKQTLEPIKEAYDRAKDFEKRMTENGIYT
ncbi:hypothetical protein DYY67_1748 [Candidatus Nitrosotalea sp. TS]|uniref:hypothetical protein n=1 Tax=Candidatus Nitrosotalea sp. TS TaxID=2341020 RepID=UPI00140CADDC|nr:hypothetical protein [Candidatus Nitrosotalea sp. TS]NHI03436.1 hypothetical protein [Candidatus Nitrosotalea sp. TS]